MRVSADLGVEILVLVLVLVLVFWSWSWCFGLGLGLCLGLVFGLCLGLGRKLGLPDVSQRIRQRIGHHNKSIVVDTVINQKTVF